MREIDLTVGNYESIDGRNLVMLWTSDDKMFYLFEKDQAESIVDELKRAIKKN